MLAVRTRMLTVRTMIGSEEDSEDEENVGSEEDSEDEENVGSEKDSDEE